jgi:hypothetical protein
MISDEAAIEYEKARDQICRDLFDKLRVRYSLKELYGEFLSWAASSAPPGIARSVYRAVGWPTRTVLRCCI